MSGRVSKCALFARLPPPWGEDLRGHIRAAVAARPNHKLVVLDDDPTGTQTVYDVPVLTTWDVDSLRAEFARPGHCFYILTNSRSLTPDKAVALNREIARNLREAVWRAGGYDAEPAHARQLCCQAFTLVSRSDSTLRGHFPIETNALVEELGPFDATILIPYFEDGGRYTINDIHYIAENDELVPVAETPFARDAAFGYGSANLRDYVEEKTGGAVKAAEVVSFSIEELRTASPRHEPTRQVLLKLFNLQHGKTAIVNACVPADAEFFALATLHGENAGGRYLFRTAAQFVAARIGLEPRPLLKGSDLHRPSGTGGLIVVGSYVPKSTEQLACLLEHADVAPVELPVESVREETSAAGVIGVAVSKLETLLQSGRDAVLFTSRQLVTGRDAEESLRIGQRVSAALVEIVSRLATPPRFFVAKGGITSSDLATRALGLRRAVVRGQILPGAPVWRLGPESRFPGLDYVVFPGNVGGKEALLEVHRTLNAP